MLTIDVTSVPKSKTRYRLHLPDGRELGVVRSPFHDGARLLLAAGFPPSLPFQTTVADRAMISIKGTIGEAAKWMVAEWDLKGLHYRTFDPQPVSVSWRPRQRIAA